jgi:hypothetical protein
MEKYVVWHEPIDSFLWKKIFKGMEFIFNQMDTSELLVKRTCLFY